MRGLVRIARAIARRCRCPPESDAAALAQQRAVALRQLLDELVRLREPRRGLDVALADVRAAVGDVGRHRVAEQIRLLKDERHLRPQAGQRGIAHVHAVDQDAPLLRVVKSAIS